MFSGGHDLFGCILAVPLLYMYLSASHGNLANWFIDWMQKKSHLVCLTKWARLQGSIQLYLYIQIYHVNSTVLFANQYVTF